MSLCYYVVQNQKAATAYFSSKQLLTFEVSSYCLLAMYGTIAYMYRVADLIPLTMGASNTLIYYTSNMKTPLKW